MLRDFGGSTLLLFAICLSTFLPCAHAAPHCSSNFESPFQAHFLLDQDTIKKAGETRRSEILAKLAHQERGLWVPGNDPAFGKSLRAQYDPSLDTLLYWPTLSPAPSETQAVAIVSHGHGASYSSAFGMSELMINLGAEPFKVNQQQQKIFAVGSAVRDIIRTDPNNYVRLAVIGYDQPFHGGGSTNVDWFAPRDVDYPDRIDAKLAYERAVHQLAEVIRMAQTRYPKVPIFLLSRSASPVIAEGLSHLHPELLQGAALISPSYPDTRLAAQGTQVLLNLEAQKKIQLNHAGLEWSDILLGATQWRSQTFFNNKSVLLWTGADDPEMSNEERSIYERFAKETNGRVILSNIPGAKHDIFRVDDKDVRQTVYLQLYYFIKERIL